MNTITKTKPEEQKRSKYINIIKTGSIELNHRYLDEQKTFIDKQLLIDSGVRQSKDEYDNHYLIYGLRTIDSPEPIQFQIINDVKDAKEKFNRVFQCSANGQPVFQPMGGKLDLNGVEYIVLTESLTKAAAIYQAVTPEGSYTACVLNCINVGNMANVARLFAGMDWLNSKLVIAADSDNDDFHKTIRAVAEEQNIKIFKPANGFKDVDDWYGSNVQFAGEEIFYAIKNAKALTNADVINTFQMSDALDGWDDEADWLVRGYLPQNSFGVVFGQPGTYKSFFTISLACHIATGKEWNNCEVEQSGVLYICAEGGGGSPRRFKAWSDEYNNGCTISNLKCIKQPVHMTYEDHLLSLKQSIRNEIQNSGITFGLVIIDTLARCFGGEDENSTKAMCAFISACDEIKTEFGSTVLVVHHQGRTEKEVARGNSALYGADDFEYMLKKPSSDSKNEVVLKCKKMKESEEPEDIAFNLKSRFIKKDKYGKDLNSLVFNDIGYEPPEQGEVLVKDETQNILLNLINSNGGEITNTALNEEFYYKINPSINKLDKDEKAKQKASLRQRKKRGLDDLFSSNLITSKGDVITSVTMSR